METIITRKKSTIWPAWLLFALMAAVMLAPWVRNREYVRSFYDYGAIIGGVGRLADGQEPYVDFVTPMQAGIFLFNAWAEKIGGGTFQGMTWGAAISGVVALLAMFGMLSRRWPLPASMLVAGGLVCATMTQHTLFWYNPWGVTLVTVVAWAGAVAPVLCREKWPWHALAGVALFLGGMNKINMQLMAIGLGAAWAVRAALTGRAGWGRAIVTLLYYIACAVLSVLAEMAWTGASFAIWWHNVIALPVAMRAEMLGQSFSLHFLSEPPHNYYGPLPLPQIVTLGLVVTAFTLMVILRRTWSQAGWMEKFLPFGCAAVALLGGAVLLMTNMDIVYIGIGGWLALLVALWLGYEIPARGGWFYGGLVLPVMVVGALGWHSAWKGQRSQFGHSPAPREAYVDGASIDPEFAYFSGTKMPPELADSFNQLASWRRDLEPERRTSIFFGTGTECLARIWPSMHLPGMSAFVVSGNMGKDEEARLVAALRSGLIKELTILQWADYWPDAVITRLRNAYDKRAIGFDFFVYSQPIGSSVSIHPVHFVRTFGGNADARRILSDADYLELSPGQYFLGVTSGRSEMLLNYPTNRLGGEVILRRVSGAPRGPMAADFAVYATGGGARFERWRSRVELAEGQEEARASYEVDSSHLPTVFTVDIPAEYAGQVGAGWRLPRIEHVQADGPDSPAWFYRGNAEEMKLDEDTLARLLHGEWRPSEAWLRGGEVTSDGIQLSPGGELWLRVVGIVTKMTGHVELAVPGNWTGELPVVRSMWFAGCRLEVFTDEQIRREDGRMEFITWGAEPGGWLVIGLEPSAKAPPVKVHVHELEAKSWP